MRGSAPTEQRTVTAGIDGGQVGGLGARGGVADAVHTTMHLNKRAFAEPSSYCRRRDAGLEELDPGSQPVLARGDAGDLLFYRPN
jgi:hypothetical protein